MRRATVPRVLRRAPQGRPGVPWAERTPRERARAVARLRRLLAHEAQRVAAAIARDCGRPVFEALAQEVLPVLETCRYLERHMPRWMRPRRDRYRRLGFLRTRLHLAWRPLGCVAVIAPGNFPFSLGLMSAVYFALAGNTVVLKPSERAPRVRAALEDLLRKAGLAPDGIRVHPGGPEVGSRLVRRADVDKVVFFGRAENGRAIERACAERGVPCVLELGAGSASIVLEDADLDRAAAGIAWSACYAGGSACVGTRRILVAGARARELEERLRDEAALLGAGARHLPSVEPVADAAHAALELARTPELLAVSIWTRTRRRARDLAAGLPVDMVWVNDAAFGLPNLPWGGRGRAGRGMLFSRHGLHEAARLQWIAVSPTRGRRPWWQPYTIWKRRAAILAASLYRL